MRERTFETGLWFLKLSVIPLFIIGLSLISIRNYLLFHTIVELAGIAVAFCIFFIVWNTRRIITNTYFLIVGISLFFTGSIDLFHTLAYKGMGVFPWAGPDLPTQLWIAARLFQSGAFLIAALMIERSITRDRRYDIGIIITVCSFVWAIMMSSIFLLHNFPSCFVEGRGLTGFKVASEYGISALFILSIILLYRNRHKFYPEVWWFLAGTQVFLIFGELAFTSYISVYGFTNMLGHLFRLISVYLLYRAIVVVSLSQPYHLLFRELKKNEDALVESENRYRSLFEHMIEGNALHEIIYDNKQQAVDYRILAVNPGYEKILHLKHEEVVGKLSTDAYHVLKPPYLERYARVEQTGIAESFEAFFPKYNSYFAVSVYSPKKGQFATVFSDISERRRTEEALVKTNKKLNLLSSITRHDIGNQLQVLFGYLEMVRELESDPTLRTYLEKAEFSAHNIKRQIAFTRDYQNIGIMSPIWQDIGMVILKASKKIDISPIQLSIEITGVEVYADPLMEKVFYNLIDNAKRYGEKITMVRFSDQEENGVYSVICEDDGTGIPDEFKVKIFNREYYKHTGFGLYLSREILDITNLTIRECGTEGEGARFEITVPEGAYRFVE